MAISNLASGLRTGVCTSTTRPTAPYNGQVIYETDSKQTLVWQGSAWVMLTDADTPPGLVLISSTTVGSAVASVTINDVFSSTCDNYRIIFSGGTANSGGGDYSIKLRVSGSTGNTYKTQASYGQYGATNATSYILTTSYFYVGYTNTSGASTTWIELTNPYLSKPTTFTASSNGDSYAWLTASGWDTSTASSTGFILHFDGATMTGGTIRVYGYRNAV